ncbi:hypothetical protein PNEG_02585 [Pneumocystis murina B123]|uniref:Ubiquitin-like domain-containing protein n=1 Tax=Pneumocystis murina (strain B123) TaxID=1069680 RepID=M7NQ76_PNEMU|nr:hypothetical protein PNEG_02585 [Pneumocystis murina B123]EMR09251.1 hypothetical protein PNEG_02585 [Pneumocystis murina B123]
MSEKIEVEKSFAKSFLHNLSQKPIRYKDDYNLPLSSLSQIPPEIYQQPIPLPERRKEKLCVDGKDEIYIHLKPLRGSKIDINIMSNKNETILNIKEKILKTLGVELSQIKLLNKGKVQSDMKRIFEILEPEQKQLMFHVMIMEKKPCEGNNEFSLKASNESIINKNSETLNLQLDSLFWEDLKSFLLTKLDTNVCDKVYNIFKDAYVSEINL